MLNSCNSERVNNNNGNFWFTEHESIVFCFPLVRNIIWIHSIIVKRLFSLNLDHNNAIENSNPTVFAKMEGMLSLSLSDISMRLPTTITEAVPSISKRSTSKLANEEPANANILQFLPISINWICATIDPPVLDCRQLLKRIINRNSWSSSSHSMRCTV